MLDHRQTRSSTRTKRERERERERESHALKVRRYLVGIAMAEHKNLKNNAFTRACLLAAGSLRAVTESTMLRVNLAPLCIPDR